MPLRPLRCIATRPSPATLFLSLLTAVSPISAQAARAVVKLADGVYEIHHRETVDGFESGNSTVIIGDRQVFVVDACFRPDDAREDIAQIRTWTNKPVAFVLSTHFHNDHNLGNRVYMDTFPAVTIIAHVDTKNDMDLFGPGSLSREARGTAAYQKAFDTGKTTTGRVLTAEEKAQVKEVLASRMHVDSQLKTLMFQSATLTFDHDFTIDLGHREVQVKFLGRGNTPGDAVVFLPKERIAMAGDLLVHPIPYMYDGYPTEWIQTLQKLAQLEPAAIVPGHGPVMHDTTYLFLVRDLLLSAVTQMHEAQRPTGPAMFRTVDDYKGAIDLSPFRQRFAGNDADLGAAFDRAAESLIRLVFREASLR
jgi:cyclase